MKDGYREVSAKVIDDKGVLKFQFGRKVIPAEMGCAEGLVGQTVMLGIREEPGQPLEIASLRV